MKNIFFCEARQICSYYDKLLTRSLLRYRLKGHSYYLFLQGLPGMPGLPGYSGRKGDAVSTFAFYWISFNFFFQVSESICSAYT